MKDIFNKNKPSPLIFISDIDLMSLKIRVLYRKSIIINTYGYGDFNVLLSRYNKVNPPNYIPRYIVNKNLNILSITKFKNKSIYIVDITKNIVKNNTNLKELERFENEYKKYNFDR